MVVQPSEISNRRILISPLNWGMGHVSRCIGLIHELLENDNSIIIACDQSQQDIFEYYFKDIEYVSHLGYPFKFKGRGKYSLDLLLRSFSLNKRRKRELFEVEDLINKYDIDLVISDHRYGFRSDRIESIFITHQLNLPVLWHEIIIQSIHKRLMKKFSELWVMDYSDSRLAGKLSRNDILLKVTFIGPYSRFQLYDDTLNKDIDEVLIVSGPDVYAQQMIDSFFEENSSTVVISNGNLKLGSNSNSIQGDWLKQDDVIRRAKKIISRSGYSTIMDLEFLKTESQLIPTPGQREQLYLSELHTESNR